MRQEGEPAPEQAKSQAESAKRTSLSPSSGALPSELQVSTVGNDLPLSFGVPEQMDLAEHSGTATPHLLHHGSQNLLSDFTNAGIDQYLGLITGASELGGDHQYLSRDALQQPLDFSFADMSDFISPDSAGSNFFASPTMFPERIHASRPPSPPRTLSSRSMPPSAPNSSPVSMKPFSSTSVNEYFVQDLEALVAVQEGWPCFRCNPSSNAAIYPKTGRIYLEGLEYTLNNYDAWQIWTPQLADIEETGLDPKIAVQPFRGSSRDKLMVITQSFLHKARDIHGSSSTPTLRSSGSGPPASTGFQGFVVLPPPDVLESLLRAYANRFEPYYPSLPAGSLKPAELMDSSNDKPSSLLLLLMIAQGAMATPTIGARYLTSGLTEASRISLFDLLEKDVALATDPIMLRSALLFMNLAAWSGDKWHMDVRFSLRKYVPRLIEKACDQPT